MLPTSSSSHLLQAVSAHVTNHACSSLAAVAPAAHQLLSSLGQQLRLTQSLSTSTSALGSTSTSSSTCLILPAPAALCSSHPRLPPHNRGHRYFLSSALTRPLGVCPTFHPLLATSSRWQALQASPRITSLMWSQSGPLQSAHTASQLQHAEDHDNDPIASSTPRWDAFGNPIQQPSAFPQAPSIPPLSSSSPVPSPSPLTPAGATAAQPQPQPPVQEVSLEFSDGDGFNRPGLIGLVDPMSFFDIHKQRVESIAGRTAPPVTHAAFKEQLEMEQRARFNALESYQKQVEKRAVDEKAGDRLPKSKRLIRAWTPLMEEAISKMVSQFLESCKPASSLRPHNTEADKWMPYIITAPPKVLANLSIKVTLNLLLQKSKRDTTTHSTVNLIRLAQNLGYKVQELACDMALMGQLEKEREAWREARKAQNAAKKELKAHEEEGELEGAKELQATVKELTKVATVHQRLLVRLRQVLAKEASMTGERRSRLRNSLLAATQVTKWTKEEKIQVGAALLEQLVNVATVPNPSDPSLPPLPAFEHTLEARIEGKEYRLEGTISLRPEVVRQYFEGQHIERLLQPQLQPMVIEPQPWRALRRGGYLTLANPAVKAHIVPGLLKELKRADSAGELVRVYEALTVLGSMPWRINPFTLDLMTQAVEAEQMLLLDVPEEGEDERAPTKLTDHQANQDSTPYLRLARCGHRGGQLTVTAGPLAGWEAKLHGSLEREARRIASEHRTLRDMVREKLETARGLAHHPAIYFPHNCDFRGRAYPLPTMLNHLGNDISRALLLFAQPRPLGPHGLRWLKIHIANLFANGKDKLPLGEREAWVSSQLAEIRASLADPLPDPGVAEEQWPWWLKGEKPWQLLATCRELVAAIDSGSPETFLSSVPVHLDGSCNGLQHYAALARDEEGGRAVNLLPAERPQDVYGKVAAVVERMVAEDVAAKHPDALRLVAGGGVNRKLVKQTVMTSVYGVTFIGARDQIINRLKERGWSEPDEIRKVAHYVATRTMDARRQVFTNAEALMSWLSAVAAEVAKSKPLRWHSPIGLLVEQPYRRSKMVTFQTSFQSLTAEEATDIVDKRAQRSAFPPNYIHSLDASHMMMTAVACRREGIFFAGVHDSFWTHACDVERLGVVLREKFVELHSQPLLEQLVAELKAYEPTADLPPIPTKGNLDLEEVKKADYFFA